MVPSIYEDNTKPGRTLDDENETRPLETLQLRHSHQKPSSKAESSREARGSTAGRSHLRSPRGRWQHPVLQPQPKN